MKVSDEANDKDITGERKSHSHRSNSRRNEEFLSMLQASINKDPDKSAGALVKMGVAKSAMHKEVRDDLHYASYKLRRRRLFAHGEMNKGDPTCPSPPGRTEVR